MAAISSIPAAIPLVAMTGDQLVRLAAHARTGQSIIVSPGALGSVGRAAVHTRQEARHAGHHRGRSGRAAVRRPGALGVATLAIDDPAAIARLTKVDAIADTVGGETRGGIVRDGEGWGVVRVRPRSFPRVSQPSTPR